MLWKKIELGKDIEMAARGVAALSTEWSVKVMLLRWHLSQEPKRVSKEQVV